MAIAFIYCERVLTSACMCGAPGSVGQCLSMGTNFYATGHHFTYAGSGGGSSRGGASCVSSSRSHRCCRSSSTGSDWLCFCSLCPLPALTSDPWSPTPCSDHGAYPVDSFGFGTAAPGAGRTRPHPLRALLRRPGVLSWVRGERCMRGKGGGRGG